MTRILLIFDYLKEAFEINKKNKILYQPQILLAVIKTLVVAFIGILIYNYFQQMFGFGLESVPNFIFSSIPNVFLVILIILVLFWLISEIFQSGLYYMYNSSINVGKTKVADFNYGVKKYFFKFLLVDLLIILAWIVLSPIFLFIGLATLFSGFTIIPVLIQIFLSMWKVSLIRDECGIFAGLKNSIRFAGKFFVSYSVFMLIIFAFTNPLHKVNTINLVSNMTGIVETLEEKKKETTHLLDSYQTFDFQFNKYFGSHAYEKPYTESNEAYLPDLELTPFKDYSIQYDNLNDDFKLLQSIIGILLISSIAVFTVGTLLSSLIRMIFGVFFGLAMFVVYKYKFQELTPGFKEEVAE